MRRRYGGEIERERDEETYSTGLRKLLEGVEKLYTMYTLDSAVVSKP